MIKFQNFGLAACPWTGGDWLFRILSAAGLDFDRPEAGELSEALWTPGIPGDYTITTVCHPVTLLYNYYSVGHDTQKALEIIGLPEDLIGRRTPDFASFIRMYLHECPGRVSKVFEKYQASTAYRLEDLPFAAYELLDTLGADMNARGGAALREGQLAPAYRLEPPYNSLPFELRMQVIMAEEDFCERYEYYG